MIKTYKDLKVYQKAYKSNLEIFQIIRKKLDREYAIKDQILRASLSLVLNIAEGYGRKSTADFKRYLTMSLGSTNEVIVLLEIIRDLNLLEKTQVEELIDSYQEIGKMLYRLRENWQ